MAHQRPYRAKTRLVEIGGHVIELYTIGWLGYAVNCHPETVKNWERAKVLPAHLLDIGSKWRYYCADEIVAYSDAYRASGLRSGLAVESTDFKRRCAMARRELRELIEKKPKKLKKELPNKNGLLLRAAQQVTKATL